MHINALSIGSGSLAQALHMLRAFQPAFSLQSSRMLPLLLCSMQLRLTYYLVFIMLFVRVIVNPFFNIFSTGVYIWHRGSIYGIYS